MLKKLNVSLSVLVVVLRFRCGRRLLPDDGLPVVLPAVQTGAFIHADPTHNLPVRANVTGIR